MKVGSIHLARRRWLRLPPRVRILAVALCLAITSGVVEFFEPAELLLHTGWDVIRSHPSHSSVVVVRIDNKTLKAKGEWTRSTADDARTMDTLFQLGARRVFMDKVFADRSEPRADAKLAAALDRHRGRVFVGALFDVDIVTAEQQGVLPNPIVASRAGIGSIAVRRDLLGYTTGVPRSSIIDGRRYDSFSSLLAEKPSTSDELFRPDYSIDYRTVPAVSLIDVLNRAPDSAKVAGKDVIVGVAAQLLGDLHAIPGQGFAPGVYVHALGAETLRNGPEMEVGWVPLTMAMLGAMALLLYGRTLRTKRIASCTAVMLVTVAPIVLDAMGYTPQVGPAVVMFVYAGISGRILARMVKSPLTGLPLLDRVGRSEEVYAGTIIGLKLRNLADLRSNLSRSEERTLVAEIVKRLRIGDPDLEIMQGDDSFVWRSPLPVSPELCGHLDALHAMLSLPIDLGRRVVDLTTAFGLDGEPERPLLNRAGSAQVSADQAMAAGERWHVHDPLRLHDADFRLSLLSQLDRAVANGEIWVAYQPKMDLQNNRVCGAEALVRWAHPERGPIRPDQFILAAEAANRIKKLTDLVLETAIRDTVALDAIDPTFSVAVNISVRLLGIVGFVEQVAELLDRYKLEPERLTLEVTESAEIDFNGPGLATLCALRELGVKVSIDDYGTKFSTLDYVRQLPASEIKIDQRFVGAIHKEEGARIMVQSTIELAHSLGLRVVAEGVELPETVNALSEMKCDVLQGYLIAKPQPFSELQELLLRASCLKAA